MTENDETSLLYVLGCRIPTTIPKDVAEGIVDGIVKDLKELGWGSRAIPEAAMAELDLEAIEARANCSTPDVTTICLKDVPALMAEARALRDEIDRLNHEAIDLASKILAGEEIERLARAENAMLREALKPFAEAIEESGETIKTCPDHCDVWESPVAMNITFGNLRVARSALVVPEDKG